MRRVLIDDIQVVLVLHQPECIEHLPDDLVMTSGLLGQQRILKQLKLLRFLFGIFADFLLRFDRRP